MSCFFPFSRQAWRDAPRATCATHGPRHAAIRATYAMPRHVARGVVRSSRPPGCAVVLVPLVLVLLNAGGTERRSPPVVLRQACEEADGVDGKRSGGVPWGAFFGRIRPSTGPMLVAGSQADDNPSAITSVVTNDGSNCDVGPYGWFCDPPAVETDTVYYTPVTYEGELGAVPEGLAPRCVDECTPDCRPPCPAECVAQKFNQRSVDLLTGRAGVYVRHEFYVNPYNGSDAWPGSRSQPWETLKRAEAQVRFLRVNNQDAPDSSKLQEPVQIWIRNFDPSQEEESESQLDNSRYMGYTIME